ncbi:MAG: phosphoribosylanthranilate isomerase [Gammaproteobacteria bacterium]
MRTRVKICGITRVEDALSAIEHGADAIGLVFFEGSPRHVTLEQAGRITAAVAPFVTVVGLFVDASPPGIRRVLENVPLGLLQFHGHEANDDCNGYGLPFIKSVAMKPDTDLREQIRAYPDAGGLLLDTWQPHIHGGGGQVFDWSRVPHDLALPVILAGGLTAANIATAIRQIRPYAVDVSSGVESGKGIKSAEKISAFMKGVRDSDADTGD